MNPVCCDGCGEKEDSMFNKLESVTITLDRKEYLYFLCPTCRGKVKRVIEGHGL